ncbi:MAG: serine/threonine protein kinase [Myxococcales bacterium]|nr:serine/threonine protein kinase [Myxococcales bacterium]
MADSFPIDFGEYRLLRKLAQGGMAEIFLAQDKKGGICAVKRILPHLAHEESFIRMFIDEARIVSHLEHPNITAVYGHGKVDGYYYIAMEFVQGHSLLAVSERAKQVKMPLPRGLLAWVVAELLAGLGYAHAARDPRGRHLGIVHRDVTPQNVLISYEGEVKLVDFGVAKARARLTQTEAGFTKGKLSYMSPEQARGEELDGRSDLFSVGIILHEITTNTRLFNKEGPGGILGAIVNDPIPRPSLKIRDYPGPLEDIVMRALDKDVGTRWQTAEEMRDALLRYGRREKPAPGQARLKDLVYDLFGAPDSQRDIDKAKALAAPTPERVEAHRELSQAQVRVKSHVEARPQSAHKPREDETRMMPSELEQHRSSARSAVARNLEITGDQVPAVKLPISRDEPEIPVPNPTEPLRVRLARFLAAFAEDLRLSWRTRRKKWVIGLSGGGVALLVLLGLATGAFGRMKEGLSGLVQSAKDFRETEGISERPAIDAGFEPTQLRIVSEPPGASITVNEIGMGSVTPYTLADLPLGEKLRVSLSLPGYRVYTEELVLIPNRGLQEYTMRLERQVGAVRVTSDPPDARIYLDGKATSKRTPATLEDLPADTEVSIKVVKKGLSPDTKVVMVVDGVTQELAFQLEVDEGQIPPGRISVESSPTGCSVFVDGNFAGTSPVTGVAAKTGSHQVKVTCEHYGEETRSVAVWSEQTTDVSFTLEPVAFGYLTIRPVPSEGSVVRINGKRVPTPVEFKKVIPGRHVVTVENRGLNQSRQIEVDVAPNARITRSVNLTQ